jgi:hypothetical protein
MMLRDLFYSLLVRIDVVLLVAGGLLLAMDVTFIGVVSLAVGVFIVFIKAAKSGVFRGGDGGGFGGCGGCGGGCGGCGGS